VSPLFGGRPLKGPADNVMQGLGLPAGTAGIVAAYPGLLDELVIDTMDESDVKLDVGEVQLRVLPTRISDGEAATELAAKLLGR
jgi:LPPG:FO 2-phospho-L-lactate transferase